MTSIASDHAVQGSESAPKRELRTRRSSWLDRPFASFHLVVAVFAIMLAFGLVMVLSSTSSSAYDDASTSAFSIFANQATFAVLGLVAFVLIVRMPLQFLRRISTLSILVSLAMLIVVLIPGVGSRWNGARSWITIGPSISFQPAEVAKLALLLWAAHVLASSRTPRPNWRSLFIPVAPVFIIMVLLIMLQPDLGTTVTLAIVFLSVLYFAGAQLWIFIGLALAGIAGVGVLAMSAGYRVRRVAAWLDPENADPAWTYQSFQGLTAMGSGGPFGVGIGQSKMKWGRLPHADSDFIFAIIGEELGLVGTLTVLLLFGLLAYTGLRIARRNVDPFVKIVAGAGTLWLVGQAAINIGYVVGLLPVTGIPLPMFSRGGTSLVVTMAVFALLANFARREPAAQAALAGRAGWGAFLGIGAGRPAGRTAGTRRKAARTTRAERAARKRAAKVRQRRADRAARARSAAAIPNAPRSSRSAVSPAGSRRGRSAQAAVRERNAAREKNAGSQRSAPHARTATHTAERSVSRGPAAGMTSSPRRGRAREYSVRRALGFPTPKGANTSQTGTRPGRTVKP